ncbi:Protein dopey-2, partial [Galemys pyrenaicus]
PRTAPFPAPNTEGPPWPPPMRLGPAPRTQDPPPGAAAARPRARCLLCGPGSRPAAASLPPPAAARRLLCAARGRAAPRAPAPAGKSGRALAAGPSRPSRGVALRARERGGDGVLPATQFRGAPWGGPAVQVAPRARAAAVPTPPVVVGVGAGQHPGAPVGGGPGGGWVPSRPPGFPPRGQCGHSLGHPRGLWSGRWRSAGSRLACRPPRADCWPPAPLFAGASGSGSRAGRRRPLENAGLFPGEEDPSGSPPGRRGTRAGRSARPLPAGPPACCRAPASQGPLAVRLRVDTRAASLFSSLPSVSVNAKVSWKYALRGKDACGGRESPEGLGDGPAGGGGQAGGEKDESQAQLKELGQFGGRVQPSHHPVLACPRPPAELVPGCSAPAGPLRSLAGEALSGHCWPRWVWVPAAVGGSTAVVVSGASARGGVCKLWGQGPQGASEGERGAGWRRRDSRGRAGRQAGRGQRRLRRSGGREGSVGTNGLRVGARRGHQDEEADAALAKARRRLGEPGSLTASPAFVSCTAQEGRNCLSVSRQACEMDPEEQELLNDYRYKSYSSGIEKALKNFESSSEWADLISSLGKLNKALQSNLKYSLLPSRYVISKRLAQCLHPALPSGVHLKALETYEIIFKIVGTKWLAKDLFLYSCGLFPLLANAAMSVRPALLSLYETYFLPLKKLLLPSLQAFIVGLLPGLEEGSEIYDKWVLAPEACDKWVRWGGPRSVTSGCRWGVLSDPGVCGRAVGRLGRARPVTCWQLPQRVCLGVSPARTDRLLLRLSQVVGEEVFYAALWGSVLVSPAVRLPASLFVVSHIRRDLPGKEQKHMLGTDHQLTVKSLCVSLLDSNVLVQRNNLEIVLFFFPFYTCLVSRPCPSREAPGLSPDAEERAIPLPRPHLVRLLAAAAQTLLRRDMSLNRRLYAWLLGSDIKGNTIVPESEIADSYKDQSLYFFERYSKDLLVEGLAELLHQEFPQADAEERLHAYLRPFRILVSLLDKPEIGQAILRRVTVRHGLAARPAGALTACPVAGPQVVEILFLEVIRAFYSYCSDALGSDLKLSYTQGGNSLISTIKENRNASEVVKTVNLLISSLSTDFLWDYLTQSFEDCFRLQRQTHPPGRSVSAPPTVPELCTLLVFLLDVMPLELYSEVQTQYLPQVLGGLVQPLAEHMDALSLPELTQALRTCFKVLSRVQMPPSYLDAEVPSGSSSPVKGDNGGPGPDTRAVVPGDEDPPFPPLKSEDSGIGLSASSPELSAHLRVPRVSPGRDDVWKQAGGMQGTFLCIQELVASLAHRHVLGVQLPAPGEESRPEGPADQRDTKAPGRKNSWEPRPISVPQLRQMLSELFTVRGSPLKPRGADPPPPAPGSPGRKQEGEWAVGHAGVDACGSREGCREAFAAACHLLLDCATFPVYLSEEETEQLCETLFQPPGASDPSFPSWLKSLMTVCCCVADCHLQNVAISTLLELINHSQSLALVIEDKMKRYKRSGHNPFFGKLQMVTVPPIAPGVLTVIAEKTDFYQRVAHVLWGQLDKETREYHTTCVELFYRLHCLAPTANICEDIICHALRDPDKGTRLEALFRFSVIWHLTREIQGSRVTSHNRSFDRSLFVVLDSLTCTDGAIGAAAQGWLVRALSLDDVARILEPVLLLLLQPKTQRTSIQCLKQENVAEGLHCWLTTKNTCREACGAPEPQEGGSQEGLPLSQLTTVDREAIWAEVEKEPERGPPGALSAEDLPDRRGPHGRPDSGARSSSEHSGSADTSSVQTDSASSSPFSSPSHEPQELSREEQCCGPLPLGVGGRLQPKRPALLAAGQADSSQPRVRLSLARVDSDKTQASESLSSDEEADLELQALCVSRQLKQQQERREAVEALFKHILLYLQPYDSGRVLYAFSVLEAVLKTNPREFIEAVSRASMDTSSTAHLNLISNLLARHQEALVGQSFYGKLQTQSPNVCPHSLLIELLTYLCLSFLRSYYPCYLKVSHRDVLGNRDVQVKSVEVLARIMTQLVSVAKSAEGRAVEAIRSLLQRCRVQEFVLLSLSASMYTSRKRYRLATAERGWAPREDSLFEESLINLGQDQIWSEHPLQIELLKLLQVLIVLEHHLGQAQEEAESQPELAREWRKALNFQQAIGAMRYVQPHPLTSQGLLVAAVVRGLQPAYGYGMHPAWVSLVTQSLPYFGKSLGWTVTPFVVQICKNLDELVKQYESESATLSASVTSKRENISPDYPLTLLEGLTSITHFCLLEQHHNKKAAAVTDPASLKNARSALLEELPRMVGAMALLWGVLAREEAQRRPSDLLGAMKGSSSVYFRTTKTIRQKILDFLNPLTAPLGVHLIAAVAAVWSRKRAKRHSKTKTVPEASAAQLTLVDLVGALSTLQTDAVLQLVKEVVKRPPQIRGDEKAPLADIPVLQFCYAFIQRLPVTALQLDSTSLLSVLKESAQLNLAPPGHFLLLSMLNDFVTRTPNLESRKDQKDLQEVTQKILEALGNIAGSSLEQTSWLSRNLEVKAQPQLPLEGSDAEEDLNDAAATSAMAPAPTPSVYSTQALSLLAEVLASLLDMVYRSDEKEKAVPLISRLLYYVFPYLRNHRACNAPSFRAGSQLLSSLSGYAYTKRAWKKEVLELFLDPGFFRMDTACSHWKAIIDHLLTHERTTFKDLMNMPSSSLKLFPGLSQKAMLLKRQAFAVFSGELDQYHLYLPLIQERLTDSLRAGHTSTGAAQMFLFFRVLLLRISPQHLTSLWPIMVSELIQTFKRLEKELKDDLDPLINSNKVSRTKALVPEAGEIAPDLYLAACKFLDTALSFPPDQMPLFQMWAFVPEVDTEDPVLWSDPEENRQECTPYTVRILELLELKYGEMNNADELTVESEFPLLRQHSVSSLKELKPFFKTLNCAFKTQSRLPADTPRPPPVEFPVADSPRVLRQLEECVEYDFLEHLEN